MATPAFLGCGTSHVFGLEGYSSTFTSGSGTITSDTGVTLYNVRSMKVTGQGGVGEAFAIQTAVLADAGRRVSFAFRTNALPDPGVLNIVQRFLQSDGSTLVFTFRYGSDGSVNIGAGGAATKSSAAGVIAIDTAYMAQICYTIVSTVSFTIKVYVSAFGSVPALVLTCTEADFSLTNTTTHTLRTGASTNGGSSTFIHYFDCEYVDDGSDNLSPGNLYTTPKLPAADSTNNFDTSIGANPGAGNRYQNVDDRPIDTATGWQQAGSSLVEESYTLQTDAVGDKNLAGATIVAHGAWCWSKSGATIAATLVRNGVDVAITLTSANAYFAAYATSASYPSGAFGMKSTGTTDDTFLYETGGIVVFTPVTPGYLLVAN